MGHGWARSDDERWPCFLERRLAVDWMAEIFRRIREESPELPSDHIRALRWYAELLESPDLSDAVMAYANDEERAELAEWLDYCEHPRRIEILRSTGSTKCGACGSDFAAGEVIAVPQCEDDRIRYCFACVTIVYEAMKAAQG